MLTARVPTTGGDELSGASGSSTTISLSGVAIGPVVDGGAPLVTLPRRGEAQAAQVAGPLLRDEAGFGHQVLVQRVVLLEELHHFFPFEEDRLQRLFFQIVLVLGGLRNLLEQVDIERGLLRRHLARQEE